MLKRVAREQTVIYPLPGRNWHLYLGPENCPESRGTLGVSIFPAGSRPPGHAHGAEEEVIYCAAGRGRIVTPHESAELEPGVMVWVPPATHHSTESDGPEPLELVCFFTPPVISGSYEKRDRS
jgi:mannose-6-phosphate isomerase-like protein (cupin superfamily)